MAAEEETPHAAGPVTRPLRCPICGEPAAAAYRPFCSKRCADVDLARWLSGRYAIAGGNSDADEDGDASLEAPPEPAKSGTD